ncbi:hypothetical protein CK203_110637 [Vitis vinifera]|uniref:Uncharacterized protein n=1 Tax=Vitis vinifera TaxID=29760 RepID=A0A438EYT6_VITVI|nr:hypothetical protein CK203_110637 [Vitis vinifera]
MALSHDGGRRYGIMTTNMSEVFNSVLKGARSFLITAFVQLTFYRVNSYFAVRREHSASRLASGEQYTPYVDAKINANVVKAGSHEIVLYDHFQGLFHVKADKDSMKRVSGRRPKSTRLHNEMDVREGIDMSTTFMDIHARVGDGPSYSAICDADVAMILGLRIHGPPITGTCDIDWSLLCSELLGVDDVILQCYARVFILALLGGALFADKTGTHCWHTYLESYVVRVWIVPQRFLDLSHYYRLHVGRPDFSRPPVPIVVSHVHDDVVDGLHDHLLPDEALSVDPLGHRWKVPQSWSHNPSPHVLTFYRDQLDA